MTVRTFQNLGMATLWAGAGFMGTKFIGNMAGTFLAPWTGPEAMPLVRIASKAGIAYVSAWTLETMFGKRMVNFETVFLGGMIEVIQDTVRTYISPQVPLLAQAEEPMMAYESVEAYERRQQLMGQGWDTPEDLPERSGAAALVGAYEAVL